MVATTGSHFSSFAFGAVLGASLTAAASLCLWQVYGSHRTAEGPVKRSPTFKCNGKHFTDEHLDIDDDIVNEQLTRNIQFLGKGVMSTLLQQHVVIVGLGGVGSHAAHMLLRSGVGQLTLVDFDQVTLSSLNRHAVATRADVGLPKATVLARHFQEIFPEARVTGLVEMYTPETEGIILAGSEAASTRPSFVLDAIDNLGTKVALLAACKRRGLPVLCVGGAGAKRDPTLLRFMDIAEATVDPLTRAVRHALRAAHGVASGIDVLLSIERPVCGLVTTEEQAAAPSMLDYQTVPNFRVRTIPVLGTSPALFGMAAASWIICKLADAAAASRGAGAGERGFGASSPFFSEPAFSIKRPQYEALLEGLQEDELARHGTCDDIAVDLEEVAFLVSSVWRGVSASALGVSDRSTDKGLHRRTSGLRLVRYLPERPCTPGNLVLLRDEEVDELRAIGMSAWQARHAETARFVSTTLGRIDSIFGVLR